MDGFKLFVVSFSVCCQQHRPLWESWDWPLVNTFVSRASDAVLLLSSAPIHRMLCQTRRFSSASWWERTYDPKLGKRSGISVHTHRTFSRLTTSNHNSRTSPISSSGQQCNIPAKNYQRLGIHTDSSLKFSSHISELVAKAQNRACVIHKCFLSKDRNTLVKAYETHVRPLLEYAVCVWSPYQLEDITKVESVQWRCTKRLYGLSNYLTTATVTG